MEDDVFYYTTPFESTAYYKIRCDGHLFKFDFYQFGWIDVSAEEALDAGWISLNREEINKLILSVYKTISVWFIEDILQEEADENEKETTVEFGNEFKYYYKDDCVVAVDDNFNEYKCNKGSMELLVSSLVDKTWSEIKEEDVIDCIIGSYGEVKLEDMELYIDEKGDIEAFSKDYKQYRLSLRTGDLIEERENKGILDSYKSCDMDYIFNLEQEMEIGFSKSLLGAMKETNKYLENNKEVLKIKQKIELGKDLIYFINPFGKVFAIDEKNQEFFVSSSHLIPLDNGSINQKEWERVDHLHALSLARFYVKRSNILKDGGAITAYDLQLFENDSDQVWGVSEDGKEYFLNEYGEFEELSKEDSFDRNDTPIALIDVILIQASLVTQTNLTGYLLMCNHKLSFEGLRQVSDEVNFFAKDDKEKGLSLFLMDDNENEYECHISSLTPLPKKSIPEDVKRVLPEQFIMYLIQANNDILNNEVERRKMEEGNQEFITKLLSETDFLEDDGDFDDEFDDEDFYLEDFDYDQAEEEDDKLDDDFLDDYDEDMKKNINSDEGEDLEDISSLNEDDYISCNCKDKDKS